MSEESKKAFSLDRLRGDSRLLLWMWLSVVVVMAGVRFSDGGALLAIARGAKIDDPAFADIGTQYVWDSPLKVALLQLLPAKIIVIAIVFGVLGLLPLAGLFARGPHLFWIAVVALVLTPSFKVSIQNLGVGDGLIILLIMLVSVSRSYLFIASSFLIIALWHPQQSFFIGLSSLLARYCYRGNVERRYLVAVLGSLAFAAAVFLTYKSSLGFTYGGREVYMTERIGSYLRKNLIYAPIAFAPVVAWFLLSGAKVEKGGKRLLVWLLGLGAVSILTADVTRVMTIISLPIVVEGANRILSDAADVPHRKVIIGAILIARLPPYSWSGLDYFLWAKLASDACKWGIHCM